jgi:hypothetical protein
METEQETKIRIDIVNRGADDRMVRVIVEERHLRRKSTRPTEVTGIEPGDVIVTAGHDAREAGVERSDNAAIALLSEEPQLVRQIGRRLARWLAAVVNDEYVEPRSI